MVPRLAGLLALLFAATVLLAQEGSKIKIEFVGEGAREVWIQSKGQQGDVPEKTSVSGKAVELDVPENVGDKQVYVHDTATGNVATKPLSDVVGSGTWTVKAEEDAFAYAISFKVEHDGKPVAAALVKLAAGTETRETLLTASDNGLATFHIVPFGDVEVTVDYESGGQDATLDPQVFESKPGMAGAKPFVLTISDEVETVAPAETTEPTEQQEEPKKEEEETPVNWFLTLVNMVIGLAIIGGIAYAVWRYVKANPTETGDALKSMGVPMQGQGQDPTTAPKKTGPPQQIILDDAAPTPADNPPPVAAAAVKNPRLVKADGSVYIVQDGDQTVGREEGRDLVVANESSVSRTHAKLSRTGDMVTVEDAGSTNGTFVNGQRIDSPHTLSPGDSVQFGAAQYRYEE